jgi:hypothetical protein
MEFTIEKRRRRPNGTPHDPLLAARAPASIAAFVHAKAAQRKVAISTIVREALAQYVERDRAA